MSRATEQGIAAAPKLAAESGDTPSRAERTLVLAFIGIWLAFQILFPLRHLLYPGYVSWTEEGHNFSWQMKLRDKNAVAYFVVRDPVANHIWQIVPAAYLLPHQTRKMIKRPDMILQFAHYLADIWAEQGGIEGVEVRAWVCVSLNGREEALLIDPNRDLTKVELSLRKADWILPLEHPPARPPARRGRRSLRC